MLATTDYDSKKVFLRNHIGQLMGTPIRCNHLILILVQEGEAKVEINYSVYHVRQNSVVMLSPLDIVNIKECSANFASWGLVMPVQLFTNEILNRNFDFYERLRVQPVVSFFGAEWDIVQGVFDVLVKMKDCLDYEQFEASVIGAMRMLYQMFVHQYKKHEGVAIKGMGYESRKNSLFRKFVKVLVASHHKSREVLFYANELGVSSGYLNEVSNEVSGYSAKEIIDSAVSAKLKYELCYTDKSVQELADEYNFPSQSYFSRYYKRLTGLSPSEYRKSKNKEEGLL